MLKEDDLITIRRHLHQSGNTCIPHAGDRHDGPEVFENPGAERASDCDTGKSAGIRPVPDNRVQDGYRRTSC